MGDELKTLENHFKTFVCKRRFFDRAFGKSGRNRVLTRALDRAELTEDFARIPAQSRWLELEQWPFEIRKNDQNKFLAECAILLFSTEDAHNKS